MSMAEISNTPEEFECSICMDGLVNPRILPCGHLLCKQCQEILLQFQDDGSAILQCPKKCAIFTTIQSDQILDDALQNIFALESFLNKIRSQSEPETVNCQGEHAFKIPSSRYCHTCRKTLCKSCLDEHTCHGDHHINIAFDHQKKSFQPICEQHKSFARNICRECNDQLICVYCKHRTHKAHDFVDLDSHVAEMRNELTVEYETAKKFIPQLRQSDEEVMKRFQEFREKLSKELLVRRVIRVNKYIAQEKEEESKILQQFDDHAHSFIQQRNNKLESVVEIENLLDKQNRYHMLVMISEQKSLLEKLQNIVKELSLKVVLSDLTVNNHLGELQFDLQDNETYQIEVNDDLNFQFTILKENVTEMSLSTDFRNIQKLQDETALKMMKNSKNFTLEDIDAALKNGVDVTDLKLALVFGTENENVSAHLYDSVVKNQWEKLKIILECTNVDVDTKYDGMTALVIAAKAGQSECVKVLLEHNCNTDIKNKYGNTALICASDNGHSECVKVLLEHNCNTDIKNNYGNTALICASFSGHSECVKVLLEHNCNTDIKNKYGDTALTCAVSGGHHECATLLKQYMK